MGKPRKPIGYDPMTGEPIYDKKPIGYDPMTGEPIYSAPKGARKPLHKKKLLVIPAVVVVAGVVLFSGVKSGLFLSKSGKVIMATVNTMRDHSKLTKNLEGLMLLEFDDYTLTWSGSFGSEFAGDLVFSNGLEQKQLSGFVNVGNAGETEFIGNLTEDELQLQMPEFSDDLYVYHYMEEKTGYLTELFESQELEAFDNILQTIFSKEEQNEKGTEGFQIIKDFYQSLDFKSVSKEEFEIDGKDRKCKGYQTTVTGEELSDFMQELDEFTYDNYSITLESEDAAKPNKYDALYDFVDAMPDTDITCYIYKGKLACVELESARQDIQMIFHGGETRMQNMELLLNGDTLMEVEGETSDSTEQYQVKFDGRKAGKLEYDYKSGDYAIDIYEGFGAATIQGVLKGNKKKFEFEVNSVGLLRFSTDIDFNITLEKGTTFQELSGEELDLDSASEAELEEFILKLDKATNDSLGI